eukprot:10732734-Karenia_brevis.AAC.1
MESWFEIKVRAVLGPEPKDDKAVTILGRIVRWNDEGIDYEADPKHRMKDKVEEWEEEFLGKSEAKEFRGLAA